MKANKNTKNTKATKKPSKSIEERLCEKADASAFHFIAELGKAIIAIPKIKEKSQEAADAKCFKILDRLLKAYVKSQADAVKAGVFSIFAQTTEPSK